MADGCRLENR